MLRLNYIKISYVLWTLAGTFCFNLGVNIRNIFKTFVPKGGKSGLNKGPKPSYITCSYITYS